MGFKSISAALVIACLPLFPATSPAAEPGAHAVRAFRVGVPPRSAELTGLGSVRCFKSAKLGFAEKGVLSAVLPEEGDQVKKGQVLARLDNRVLLAQIKAKEARVESAKLAAKHSDEELKEAEQAYRVRAVVHSEVTKARHKYEQALSELKLSRAELAGLKAQLKNTVLTSPIAGTVVERLAEPGEVAGPNTDGVLVVMACDKILAEVSFGEKLYTRIQAEQPVLLTADALPRRDFIGRVYAKSPKIDDKDRSFKVKVFVENQAGALRPGMFVRALLLMKSPLWIPQVAVLDRKGDQGIVKVVKDRKATPRRVSLGREQRGMVQVIGGLNPGELIMVGPAGGQAPKSPAIEPGADK